MLRLLASALLTLALFSISASAANVGIVDFPVTAKSQETRTCFNRAVAMLHSFWFEEAREQFETCASKEPDFQMAWWGVAMTYNHSLWNRVWVEEARAALSKIQAPEKLSARERAYIDAVRLLFGEGKKKEREKAYAKAMGAIAKTYPDDLEAATFYSLSLIATDQNIRAGAIALDVYAKQPEHPGAAHYIIHAFDDPKHAILALPAARRYAQIAPEAHHAMHMPSHIFLQLGMWEETVNSNTQSWAASVAWQSRKKLPMSLRDYHSQYWLAYGLLQQGRREEAWKVWEEKRKDVLASQGDGDVYRYWADLGAAMIVETGSWDKAAAVFEDPATIRVSSGQGHAHTPSAAARAMEGFARGLAAAHLGQDIAPWVDKLEQAKTIAEKNGNQANMANFSAQILMVKAVDAHLKKDHAKAMELLDAAQALEEKEAAPSGPPHLIKPTHELAGEILLASDKPAEALSRFQKSLERQPNRSASLVGALSAAEKLGDKDLALEYRTSLNRNWAKADKKPSGSGE